MKYKKFQVRELGFNNFFTILSHSIYNSISKCSEGSSKYFYSNVLTFYYHQFLIFFFYRKHKNELNEKSFSSMKAFLAFDQKIFDILLSSTFWWREKSHKNRNYYIHAVLVISHQHKNYHLYELKERHFKDPSWYSWCGKSSKSI